MTLWIVVGWSVLYVILQELVHLVTGNRISHPWNTDEEMTPWVVVKWLLVIFVDAMIMRIAYVMIYRAHCLTLCLKSSAGVLTEVTDTAASETLTLTLAPNRGTGQVVRLDSAPALDL